MRGSGSAGSSAGRPCTGTGEAKNRLVQPSTGAQRVHCKLLLLLLYPGQDGPVRLRKNPVKLGESHGKVIFHLLKKECKKISLEK